MEANPKGDKKCDNIRRRQSWKLLYILLGQAPKAFSRLSNLESLSGSQSEDTIAKFFAQTLLTQAG